jgi:putative thioredoxin
MSYDVTDFERDVLQRSQTLPVLVDFWAPWCGPCKMLAPVLERLAAQAGERWLLAKVNTEEQPALATQYEIASIPNVKLFVRGEVVDEFLGAMPEPEIRRWLSKALPSPHAETVARAERLVAENRLEEAARELKPVIAAEPANEEARVLLARCQLVTEPRRISETLSPVGADSDFADRASGLRLLGQLASDAGQPARFPEAPVRARFLVGARALKSGDFDAALEAFIAVLERNRDYHGGIAKAACKAIFQVLGIRHPIAERHHRAFASALHA